MLFEVISELYLYNGVMSLYLYIYYTCVIKFYNASKVREYTVP